MTEDEFRAAALALPGAEERAHMGHPDFRVEGRIFAGLKDALGSVKLAPDQQRMFVDVAPDVVTPAAGAWGRSGWTRFRIEVADPDMVVHALTLAHAAVAARARPKRKPGASG